jgi:hypothetical protein
MVPFYLFIFYIPKFWDVTRLLGWHPAGRLLVIDAVVLWSMYYIVIRKWISILMICTCIALHSLFCQLPNCNLFSQHVIYLYGETPLVNYGPRYILLHIYYRLLSTSIIYFLANKQLLPHDTFNSLFTANQWDWQPHCKLGQSTLVILCACSMLLLALKLRPRPAP